MNVPYSFAPLFTLLEEIDMTIEDLIARKIISKSTAGKIATGQQVMIGTVAKICLELGCDFSDVVELNYDFDPSESVDDGTQSYQRWTEEEDDRLVDEYQKGFPIAEIAKDLNREPGAISSRIKMMVYSGRVEKRVAPKKERK